MSENKKQSALIEKVAAEMMSLPAKLQTEDDVLAAADLLLKVRSTFNEIESKMTERTAPAAETIKLIKEDYKKFLEPLSEFEASLKKLIEEYANMRTEEDTLKLQKLREETGDDTLSIQIGLSVLPSTYGDVKLRKGYSIQVADETKVPRKFWTKSLDLKAIQKLVDDSEGTITIPGITIGRKNTVAIYAKK